MINQPDASLSTTVRRTGKPTVSVFLRAILIAHGHPELAGLVRPLLVIVGGRLVIDRRPAGVAVVMTAN